MNIAHLKYAVEVEKTASITKAAENLFMGQPNLSRGIKELEETLGVKIFKRTSKGIVPTPQGEEFLGYAKSILAQIEEMESLYKPEKNNKLKFSISVPRASYIADAFSKFVREADMSKEIEFSFKETNAMRAIRNVVQENYGLAIVRYQTIFESFFTNMLRDKGMKSENIWEFEYQLLISKNDPLSQKDVVDIELAGFQVITTLLELMTEAVCHPEKAYSQLLINRVSQQYDIGAERLYDRIMAVLDYISGMTDVYALDLYRKINGMSLPFV